MTVKEAAQRTGKSEITIRRWIREGKLKAIMIDGKYDIEEAALNARLEQRDHFEKGYGTEESLETQRLLDQNMELSKQVSQLKETIENQKAVIEGLLSQLPEEQEPVERSGKIPEPATAKHLNIGTYTRRYEDGEIIFEEGSIGKDIYFVVYGEVEVSQLVNDQKMIVATLESGSFFGEMAPLTGHNRTMTITAKGIVYLWKMSSDEMFQYMRLSPQFAMHICIKMAQRLGCADLLLRHLAVKTLPVDSNRDVEGETLRYLYRKLTERAEELKHINEVLQKKDDEIKELRRQLEPQKPSLFLRGLERSRQKEPGIRSPASSIAVYRASRLGEKNAILKPNYVSWKQRSMPKLSRTR